MAGAILIVEDDPDIRNAIADVIADEGHATLTAANGREALDRLNAGVDAPALILLDLMMPVMDGWQFAAGLRAVERFHDVPIVIVSAGDDIEMQAQLLGARGHLRKPVNLDDLLELVGKCAP